MLNLNEYMHVQSREAFCTVRIPSNERIGGDFLSKLDLSILTERQGANVP